MRALLPLALFACLGCGGGGDSSISPLPDGATPGDSSTTGDATATGDSSAGDGAPDHVTPPPDSGPGGWDGGFNGPLACATPGNYKQNWSGSCGVQRWDVKTGTDSAAAGVSLLPTLTTLTTLISIPQPGTNPTSRLPPTEATVFALKDVKLIFARLEDDSDYHLVISDAGSTMITEVPYPAMPDCVNGGPWDCLISRARANVDAQLNLVLNQGHNQNLVVSVIGVGFFDPEHGQYGVAPNNLELHPLLGICFGQGCDPTK